MKKIFQSLSLLLILILLTVSLTGIRETTEAVSTKVDNYNSFEAARSILSVAGYDSPDREIMQIIDNVFHRWYEYDLDGERLIFLEEPCRKILDKKEIQELYNKSRQWMNGTENYDMYMMAEKSNQYELDGKRIPSPEKHVLPVEFKPKYGDSATSISNIGHKNISMPENKKPVTDLIETSNVIGEDDRLRVEETTVCPFNTVGYIESTYMEEDLYSRGTAFLVSPYIALTCAHNVYDSDYKWADIVDFAPGQYQLNEGGYIYWPYGYKSTTCFEICAGFVDYGNDLILGSYFDFGALFFGEPFTGIDTFVPVVFNCNPEWVFVVGYPAVVQNENDSYSMWISYGNVLDYSDSNQCVCFDADVTPGNSGGPVWTYDEVSDSLKVVSIAASGIYDQSGPLYNRGPAFNDYNRDLIMGWVNWHPYIMHGDPNGDGDITVQDAIMVLRSVVGLVELNEDQTLAADVDGSGLVDVNDAILILRYVVGLIGYFPVRY
ncbi:MAG: hypothetical protein GX887_07350 [Firmicutes bacterium]|nr:hypothetical protein [Bacillota bacterium]